MKRLFIIVAVLSLVTTTSNAQSFLNRLKNKAIESTEKAVEKKVDEKVDEAVNKAVDKAAEKTEEAVNNGVKNADRSKSESKNAPVESAATKVPAGSTSYTSSNNANLTFDDWDIEEEDLSSSNVISAAGGGNASVSSGGGNASVANSGGVPQSDRAVAKYNKFDFVAGDKIIFEDNQVGETLGEFPSQWDLVEGMVEIANVGENNVIAITNNAIIAPFMKDLRNNLGEVFTVEFDYYQFLQKEGEDYGDIVLSIFPKDGDLYGSVTFELSFPIFYEELFYHQDGYDPESYSMTDFRYVWNNTNEERRDGNNRSLDLGSNNWIHVSMSFNKRALKVYINETRVVNIPNMKNDCGWLAIKYGWAEDNYPAYIRNIRIAQGAVPLYDRMMSDGKFITYGITFDVGKSSLKPESMGEINRIVRLMNEKPELKFSVEGHTDATGSVAANQTLSEARSKVIVDMLVSLGIAPDRLASSGKGQTSPINDNSTTEGRAKNRRVEFVLK